MTHYLTLEEIIYLNEQIIKASGGHPGIRDFGLLHAAVERPKASFGNKDLYTNLFAKAAALVHSLILNHSFVDGNKRTALAAMTRFLETNNTTLKATNEVLVKLALTIEKKKYSIKSLGLWIKRHSEGVEKSFSPE